MSARFLPAVLLAAVLTLPALAAAAEPDDAALKKRLDTLEQENAKLKSELAKAKADTKKLFDAATNAEKAAGLSFRRPTAVAAQASPATVPPVGQPATKHAGARFDEAELEMNVSFGAARNVRTWRVHDAICDVTKRNR